MIVSKSNLVLCWQVCRKGDAAAHIVHREKHLTLTTFQTLCVIGKKTKTKRKQKKL